VSQRDTIWLQDPLRRAAETLARDVETYLYDSHDPKHNDHGFLMWAVNRYDVAKTGSGRYADDQDYDPTEARKDPRANVARHGTTGRFNDIDVRLPAHSREKLDHDGTPTPPGPDAEAPAPTSTRPDLPTGVKDGREYRDEPQSEELPLVNDKPFVSPNSPSGEGLDSDGEHIPMPPNPAKFSTDPAARKPAPKSPPDPDPSDTDMDRAHDNGFTPKDDS
jgi:hypothetical protein